jgi:protease-4
MSSHKESILTLILKKFMGSFASVIGFFLALFIFSAFIGFSMKESSKIMPLILPMKVEVNKDNNYLPLAKDSPLILRVNIEGTIGGKDSFNTSNNLRKIFDQASLYNISKDRIKGVLLCINSPGGSAMESDSMYEDIMSFKKELNIPVHVWIKDICASGGYYLACAGDYISAQRVAITGSVGVLVGPNFNFYGLMQKIGVEEVTLTAGKSKIPLPMFSKMPADKSSYQYMTDITESIYNRFTDVVDAARGKNGLTKDKIIDIGAKVFISQEAKKLGYIDASGVRYNEAELNLAKVLQIEDKGYQTISFYKSVGFAEMIKSTTNSLVSFFSKEDAYKEMISLKADFAR